MICSPEKSFPFVAIGTGHSVFPFCISWQEIEETIEETKKMNMYCHFARGIGEPKYMPVQTWESLNRILVEALDNHNEVNAVMNLVLFEDAMCHV